MRKGNLLLCGIVAAAMIVPSCWAADLDVEYKRVPDWFCPMGMESYTDKNSAMAPIWHTDLKGCNFANQWGEILTTDYFDRIGDFSEGMAWVVTNGTVGYIDTMGTLVIRLPENILSCGDFHNGRALIEETDGDKYYIDKIMELDRDYELIYEMRPGLTSEATLYNGYTDTMEKMLRRLHMDIHYLEHRSLSLDFSIIMRTALSIVSGKKF